MQAVGHGRVTTLETESVPALRSTLPHLLPSAPEAKLGTSYPFHKELRGTQKGPVSGWDMNPAYLTPNQAPSSAIPHCPPGGPWMSCSSSSCREAGIRLWDS